MIVAGVGFRSACTVEDLVDLVRQAAQSAGAVVSALAVPAFKAGAPQVEPAAAALGLPVVVVDEDAFAAVQSRCLTRSAAALAAVGVASVAEACALAAAGPGGRLLGPRRSSVAATCALAELVQGDTA
jgi:cobalt-precorrin 5A hydrolase